MRRTRDTEFPKMKPLTAIKLRAALLTQGHTFASLAHDLGCSRQHVQQVANGRVSERVAKALAKAAKVPLGAIRQGA